MENIVILTSSFPNSPDSPEGGGTFVKILCKNLSNQFNIHILAPYVSGCIEEKEQKNISVKRFKYFFKQFCTLTGGNGIVQNINKNLFNIFKLPFFFLFQFIYTISTIKRTNSKIVHFHWVIPQGITAVLAKKYLKKRNIKILLTVHGSDFNSFKNSPLKGIINWIFNNVNEITVVSQALKTEIEEWGIKQDVLIYPMGVDSKLFTPNPNISPIPNQLLFVGSLLKTKGLLDLIEAIPKVLESVPEFKLNIVGPGNNKIFLNKAIELNVQSNIIWSGSVANKDLPRYFHSSSAFILPSHSEGFGIVCIESMACNCITIVSELPATSDYITRGSTGFFIEPKNPASIAKQIINVLTSDSDLNKIRFNARELVKENFDWKAVTKNYSLLLSKMINE